jgi:ubiquinone/menaquinone biosynthesis C-methylase UbiE
MFRKHMLTRREALRTGAALTVAAGTGCLHAAGEKPERPTLSFWEPLDRQMIDWLKVRPGDRVLDAGCGVGHHAAIFAEKVTKGAVDALDISPKALEAARARLRATPHAERVTFHEGDVLKPPFEKATFDLAWTSHVLHILKDPVAGAKALKGVLRKGGRLAVREDGAHTWMLPLDTGVGRPGLESRTTAAFMEWFVDDRLARGRVPFGWTEVLRKAGLTEVRPKSFLFEADPPFTAEQTEYLRKYLRGRLRETLTAEDKQTLEQITDPKSEHDFAKRPDLRVVSVSTVYVGQA